MSKRVSKRAVVRNRIRGVIRESFAQPPQLPSCDVPDAQTTAAQQSSNELRADLETVAAIGSIEDRDPGHNAGPFQIPFLPNPQSLTRSHRPSRESSPMRAGALNENGARRRASNRIDRT